MARDFIKIDVNQTHGNNLVRAISMLRQGMLDLKENVDIMLHNTDAADYSDIATLFGATRGSETADAVGEALYNLANGANAELQADTTLQSLLDQVGAV